jgi:ribosome-associated translation inhibitor RaiA
MGNIKDPIDFLIEAEEEKLRKKIEWPEDQLDYSDSVTIKITKVNYGGFFSHWEADLHSKSQDIYCEVTAPTMGGAIDEVINYLYDSKYEWTKDDANGTRPTS